MRGMNAPASSLPLPPSPDTPTPLLGGLSPSAFMRRHWQKKPLLIRQAVPGVQPPLDRAALFALAGEEAVESRLIVQQRLAQAQPGKVGKGAKAGEQARADDAGWSLKHGPLNRRSLPPLTQPGWTLLVQGLDLHVPAAHELLQRFRFVPDARLDDLMISYATDGGGVGPHYDSYDVFLLQVHGQRRWRVGKLKDDSLQPDVPLKILSHFEPEEYARQVLADLAGVIMLDGLLALGLEPLHRRKDPDLHKKQDNKTSGQICKRVPIPAVPLKQSR